MKLIGDRELLEKLRRKSPLAASLPPELQERIIFRIGEDGRGTWEHPETRIEYGLNLNEGAETQFRKERAMLPFDYLDKTAKDFRWDVYGDGADEAKGMVNDYIRGFQAMRAESMGLYIYSATKGSGKTFLACCILNELAARFPALDYKFCTVPNLIELSKDFENGESKGELHRISQCSFLILDDIGTELKRDWSNDVLFRLIDGRQNRNQITMYTSNVTPKRLKLAERITSRISANSYPVHLPEVPVRDLMAERRKREILDAARKKINAPA